MSVLVVPALLLAAAAAATPDPSACLDPNKPLTWTALGERSLVVESLGRHWLVELEHDCDLLPYARTIGFEGTGLANICGRFGEAVRVKGTKCRIATLTRIDEQRYGALVAARRAQKAAPRAEEGD